MTSESAYTKRLTEETKMDKIEGVLEHLNLPPKAIDFIRKNQRILQVLLVVIIVLVVSGSLYKSYREGIVESASSALSTALKQDGEEKAVLLATVIEEYGNTNSAQWAKIELAHIDMKNGSYAAAAKKYIDQLTGLDEKSALYGLLLFGAAQALEADGNYAESAGKYNLLKEIVGYTHLGYTGLARIEESQGNLAKADTIYNNYLLNVGDDPSAAQARIDVEARIARLKAKM